MFQGRVVGNSTKIKTLKAIEFAVESPKEHTAKLTKKSKILTAIAWIGLFVSFLLYFQELRGFYLPVLASISGILYGMSIYLDSTIKQWPIVAKYVNIESVKQEIGDLET